MKNYLTNSNNNDFFNFFDDAFENFFSPVFFAPTKGEMKTDVTESDNAYNFSIDLPGFEKQDIELSLDDGYLTVSAKKQENSDDKYLKI